MATRKKGSPPKSFTTVVRDAVTGRFLPKKAAKRRSTTTITQRIRPGGGRKKANRAKANRK